MDKLIDIKEVAAILGVSKPSIYRMLKNNKMPQPMRLTRGTVRWRSSDIQSFISNGRPKQ